MFSQIAVPIFFNRSSDFRKDQSFDLIDPENPESILTL